MKAILCDRCNKPFTEVKRGDRKYTLRTIGTEVVRKQMSRGCVVDLCPDCYNDLMVWLKGD